MKTQQAHSNARDAALRSSEIPARRGAVPTVWLNLVCLDAPIVAVVWLWLFARSFHLPVQVGNAVALFLTAWLIYLADRFADAFTLKPGMPRSLRQDFCLRHREIWIATLALVAGFDGYVIWRTTAIETFLIGGFVGGLALIYLVVNHPLGLIWRSLPAKELAIGILFTAGTLVALMPAIPSPNGTFVVCAISFAALCALNCISIAGWERELDRAQGKVSIVTRHPNFANRTDLICAGFSLACFALILADRSAGPILACIGASALLLSWLSTSGSSDAVVATALGRRRHAFGRRQSAVATAHDQRTALADLVLLTPLIPLIAMAL